MTREEAIAILEVSKHMATSGRLYNQAIDMAIEALSAEDVVPYEDYRKLLYSRYPDELVRCKDCRHGQYDATHYFCAEHYHKVYEDDYCSHGERRCNYFGERREP